MSDPLDERVFFALLQTILRRQAQVEMLGVISPRADHVNEASKKLSVAVRSLWDYVTEGKLP